MIIRFASENDAEAIRKIYAPYVTDTAITFEYTVPDTDEFVRRIKNTLANYPYLVAQEHEKVVGYAYAGPFRPREAYKHSCEVSIYVSRDCTGRGIGRALYNELEKHLAKQNVFVLYSCITETERENDSHLTDGSIKFHEKMGYSLAGKFYHCGYKFGKWYSMRWMEKVIAPRPAVPDAFIPFPAVPGGAGWEYSYFSLIGSQ